jgi:hypothetical protein
MNRKMRVYEWQMREWLFFISFHYLGWPPKRNRWIYPDVYGWDADDQGNNVIPAIISFYRNQQIYIPVETQYRFKRHLGEMIPGPWRIDWNVHPGLAFAERTPITIPHQINDREVIYHNLTTVEVEAIHAGYSTNGQRSRHELEGRSYS